MKGTLAVTGDPAADKLLNTDPLVLLVGMLLDQQVPMERAFAAPAELARRLGTNRLDAARIAAYDPEEFAALFSRAPALHRFPGSMAGRVQSLAQVLVGSYGGDAAAVWTGVRDGAELLARLQELPGFGRQKAQIFLALLGKRFGVHPRGWREAAGGYGEDGSYRSVADIVDADSLARVRAHKQQMKAEAKAAATAPAR